MFMSGRKDVVDKKYDEMLKNIDEGGYVKKYRKGITREIEIDDVEETKRVHENFIKNFTSVEQGKPKIIIKAADYGTLETIESQLAFITDDQGVQHFDVLKYEVGTVTETDLVECLEFEASIYCFNITPTTCIEAEARTERIPLYKYDIIYRLFEDLKKYNEELSIQSTSNIDIKGSACVQQIFEINLNKAVKLKVAGLKVNEGFIKKNLPFRLMRNGNVVCENLEAVSLKKFKKEVGGLKGGDEGGISFKKVDEIMKGDIIECYASDSK